MSNSFETWREAAEPPFVRVSEWKQRYSHTTTIYIYMMRPYGRSFMIVVQMFTGPYWDPESRYISHATVMA